MKADLQKFAPVAIIGCGLIGKKRAAALRPGQIPVVCDLKPGLAESLAATRESGVAPWLAPLTTDSVSARLTESASLPVSP